MVDAALKRGGRLGKWLFVPLPGSQRFTYNSTNANLSGNNAISSSSISATTSSSNCKAP